MANSKSSKKRVLVNETKAMQNKATKSALKTALKKADAACAENTADKVEVVTTAIKKVDQAAAKGIMHKNCASRKKSQLAVKLNATNN